MTIKHLEEYRDSEISLKIIQTIHRQSRTPVRLMEVCGTHTMAIFKSGLRSVLPEQITLLSGPGCPVCVTAQAEIDGFIELARKPDVIITTFGDLLRVPGSGSSLQKERARGGDIRIVYSAADAVDIARNHPDKTVVFLGVGFETTAPTIGASILTARAMEVDNFCVFCAHKRVPPALAALLGANDAQIDGFILPGHVSVIIGLNAYAPLFDKYRVPCAVAGFEPLDVLQGICALVEMIESRQPKLENSYKRAVTGEGNTKAQAVLQEVFETVDGNWRGIGTIPSSGLAIRDAFAQFDAQKRFTLELPHAQDPKGCACGEILKGLKTPPDCPLYKKTCTPADPVGPCMVSSEGTCAAYYRYHG